jgi:hypothetical protein
MKLPSVRGLRRIIIKSKVNLKPVLDLTDARRVGSNCLVLRARRAIVEPFFYVSERT